MRRTRRKAGADEPAILPVIGLSRTGSSPQLMATLRNTAIRLLRLFGHTNIAKAARRMARHTNELLAVLGV